jgi:protein-S-isoprenylcysteine O-methyltransferase Ste14
MDSSLHWRVGRSWSDPGEIPAFARDWRAPAFLFFWHKVGRSTSRRPIGEAIRMKRGLIFVYGVLSYAVGFATLMYAIGFLGNFGVPKSIDSAREAPFVIALSIDLAVLALFAVQHSVMARPAFKRWWTRIVPEAAERSTYVLFSGVALSVLFVFWQPMGGVVWDVGSAAGRMALYAGFAFGWVLLLACTFLLNHFDLFGLRQVWLYLRGKPYTPLSFGTPLLYRYVRHPLYVGLLFAFWCTPTMTVTHLVFAIATSVYILIAIQLEERDLLAAHPEYEGYRRRVPMLVPFT